MVGIFFGGCYALLETFCWVLFNIKNMIPYLISARAILCWNFSPRGLYFLVKIRKISFCYLKIFFLKNMKMSHNIYHIRLLILGRFFKVRSTDDFLRICFFLYNIVESHWNCLEIREHLLFVTRVIVKKCKSILLIWTDDFYLKYQCNKLASTAIYYKANC